MNEDILNVDFENPMMKPDEFLLPVIIFLVSMSLVTFVLFSLDKLLAKKRMWRIPEKMMQLFALFGGAIGGLAAMMMFSHKTSKKKFLQRILMFMMIHIVIICCLVFL